MQDVADRAGVSLKTVSNVVNGFPSIRQSTRDRVEQALQDLGYRPNMAARSLAGGRTGLLGLLLPYINTSYFGRLAASLVARSRDHDLTPMIQQTGGTSTGEDAVLSHLRRHFVDGMVGTSLWLTDAEVLERTKTLPLVMIGQRWGGEPRLNRVSVNCHQAGSDAVAHLISQGRRQIGLLGLRPKGHLRTDGRYTGAMEQLTEQGLRPTVVGVGWYDHLHGYLGMKELLATRSDIDGVFCFNDELALGALSALREAGVSCPDDVAIVGFDDTREGRFASTAVTSVSYSTDEMAAAALDRLTLVMDGSVALEEAHDIVIGHTIAVRESTAKGAGLGPADVLSALEHPSPDPEVEILEP